MKKILLLLILLFPINIYSLELPEVSSDTVVIYDVTEDKMLFNKNGESRHDIASLTKIATIMTIIDRFDRNIMKKVTITDQMRWAVNPELSIHKIQTGEEYTYADLMQMCMKESAADACMALAFDFAGNEAKMTELVNEEIKKIGLEHTHFTNITGLDDPNHYSSANDILKLLQYSIKNETFMSVYTGNEAYLSNGQTIYPTFRMIAKMLNLDLSQVKGAKTGFTDKAGLCFASLIRVEDHEMIMITLGAPPVLKEGYHIRDAYTLINFLEDNYNYETLYNKDNIIKTIEIELSKQETFDVKVKEDVKKFLPSDYDNSLISYKYEGKDKISYLDKKGAKIGKVSYYYNNELLYEHDVIIDIDIEYSITKLLNKYKYYLIGMLSLLILLIILIVNLRRKKVVKK